MPRSDGDPKLMGNAHYTHKRKKSRVKGKLLKAHKQAQRRKRK